MRKRRYLVSNFPLPMPYMYAACGDNSSVYREHGGGPTQSGSDACLGDPFLLSVTISVGFLSQRRQLTRSTTVYRPGLRPSAESRTSTVSMRLSSTDSHALVSAGILVMCREVTGSFYRVCDILQLGTYVRAFCNVYRDRISLSLSLSLLPEVDEDVDQPPVVHPVRPVVTPPLYQPVLPVPPGEVVAHQQPALQGGERGGNERQRSRRGEPVPPPGTLVAQQLFQRGQRENLRLPEPFGAGGPLQRRRRPWLQDGFLASTGAVSAAAAAGSTPCAILFRRPRSALPAVPRQTGTSRMRIVRARGCTHCMLIARTVSSLG